MFVGVSDVESLGVGLIWCFGFPRLFVWFYELFDISEFRLRVLLLFGALV